MTHNFTDELKRLRHEHHDSCVNCGYNFQEGDTTHSGYDKNDNPIYVCDNCADMLKETAVRNYFKPRPYKVPEDDSKLWRYMDFAKYVSLLSSQSIYFSRADQFEDNFEGAKGVVKNKSKWDEHYLSFFKKAIKNPPEDYEFNLSKEELEKESKRLLNELEVSGEKSLQHTFLSCWHENELESEAMWRIYSSYLDNAVAIQTTYKKLYHSLGPDPSIKIGRVKYINYSKSFAGPNNAFWRKRKSFQHENEVRAIIIRHDIEEVGIKKDCDIDTLIDSVHVSPNAPEWFQNLVTDVSEKYGHEITAQKSNLNADPFY